MQEKPVVAADLVVEEIDGDLCLLRLDTNDVLVLNRSASDVWLLASDGMSADQIVDTLCGNYARPRPEIEEQVTAVLADLTSRGFLPQ